MILGAPDGTIVRFDGFLRSSSSASLPFCLRPGGRDGRKQNEMQAEGFAAAGVRGIQYK